ncbi:MAG: 16S rRNA (guanine(527)-N(7))-methyltransferase RsmG [Tannerella sp.]|jgi:16S rRNA (guanine527-N7)-methyltransferase|nr:16S rRNA (guanine(527)-N(7))-methyltransferase RsmG [Tannerella sp.]
MDIITKYFREITDRQRCQFEALGGLYGDWNAKINLISRRDIDNLYERHVLHSLGIAKAIRFKIGSVVMDAGTGGGFPGIPLAILFPDVSFHLVDATGKKIRVVENIVKEIDLQNVTARHCRLEEEKSKFDFVVSRAVMTLPELVRLIRKNIAAKPVNAIPNGLLCLKGERTANAPAGEKSLASELAPFGKNVFVTSLKDFFTEDYFKTKKIIHIPL